VEADPRLLTISHVTTILGVDGYGDIVGFILISLMLKPNFCTPVPGFNHVRNGT
jgi:hypothetical protein